MVSVCLPSDALLQHLPSHLGFSYLGQGYLFMAAPAKCSRCSLPWTRGYLLTAAVPDLQRGIAPLGPPVPAQPLLLGLLLPAAGPGLGHGWLLLASAPGLGRGVAPPAPDPGLWITALSNSMKPSHARGATQDGRVTVERSDRMWSTGEGNGKPVFLP